MLTNFASKQKEKKSQASSTSFSIWLCAVLLYGSRTVRAMRFLQYVSTAVHVYVTFIALSAFLIECTMLLMVLMSYPFLAAFVWLRYTQPDVPRAFRIPGGTFAAFLWTIPPNLIGTAYLYIWYIMPYFLPTKLMAL